MEFEELMQIFDVLDDDKKPFARDTLEEYLFFKSKITELKKLPLIRVSKKNPEKQEITPAGKLLKDYSQVLDAKRSTLLRLLYKVESSAADDLLNKLSEFET